MMSRGRRPIVVIEVQWLFFRSCLTMCSPGRRDGDVRYLFEGWNNNNLNNPRAEIFT